MSDADKYTPERFDGVHFKVLIETKPCATCGVPTTPNLGSGHHDPFPRYIRANFAAQIERAGISLVGTYQGDSPICKGCYDKGAVLCECAICHQSKRSTEIQETFGCVGVDYLCKGCYETVPAMAWDREVEALNELHRYDYE